MNRAGIYWFPIRPDITIEKVSGVGLGRCYSQTTYRVTANRRLTRDQLETLARIGIIPAGQEFGIISQCDGKEEPAFSDEVEPTALDRDGHPTATARIDITNRLNFPYWVYECYERTDSSD